MRVYVKTKSICNEDWQCMQEYIKKYGWHFNDKMCSYATSLMTKKGKALDVLTKQDVDKLLASANVVLSKTCMCDYVFVANMGKADFLGSSIEDDRHLALYVKDTIEDEDACDGTIFRRWCATMTAAEKQINWAECL